MEGKFTEKVQALENYNVYINGLEQTKFTKLKIDPSYAYTVALSKDEEVDDKSTTQTSTTTLYEE